MLKTQRNQLTIANVGTDQLTSGLQHVGSILYHLRTGDGMTTLVETRDLWNLEFKGDAQMPEYRTRWTYIITNMVTVIPEKELSKLMYEQIRAGKSKGLEIDMADYRRLLEKDCTFSHAEAPSKEELDRLEKMMAPKAYADRGRSPTPSAGGEKGKGKKGRKGKTWGKGEGRSTSAAKTL